MYTREFYAYLAVVSFLAVVTNACDLLIPGKMQILDMLSIVLSALAGMMALTVSVDLYRKRPKA